MSTVTSFQAEQTVRRRRMWVLVVIAAVMVMVTVAGLRVITLRGDLEDAQAATTAAQQDLDARQVGVTAAQDDQIKEATGADPQRVATDRARIDRLMETANTWDSAQAYTVARGEVMDQLDLDENAQFVTDFMSAATYSTDGTGERTYYLDVMGVQSQLSGTQVYVESVRADQYRYMVIAQTTITSTAVRSGDGAAESNSSSGEVFVELTMDSSGAVHDITGWAAGGQARQS